MCSKCVYFLFLLSNTIKCGFCYFSLCLCDNFTLLLSFRCYKFYLRLFIKFDFFYIYLFSSTLFECDLVAIVDRRSLCLLFEDVVAGWCSVSKKSIKNKG